MTIQEEQKLVELFSKLKSSGGGYPSDLLTARRNQYVRQVANVGLGIGLGIGARNSLKGLGKNTGNAAATITSKVLEGALIAAIAIEAGAIAYMYRDQIRDKLHSYAGGPVSLQVTPIISNVSGPKNEPQQQATLEPTSEPTLTPSPTASLTPVPSSTPVPTTQAVGQQNTTSGETGSSNNSIATKPPKENNGNQYGLTPKPERTKENGGNHNNDDDKNQDNGNKNNKDNKKDK